MAQTFQFELVSPEKLLVSQTAVMVTVPGGEGEYGVLAGHAPMITTVKMGVINIYGQDDKTISDRIFVVGGFAEVNDTRCTVLAEEAVPVAEIDRATVEAQIVKLTEDIQFAKDDLVRANFTERLEIAQAKLEIISIHHH